MKKIIQVCAVTTKQQQKNKMTTFLEFGRGHHVTIQNKMADKYGTCNISDACWPDNRSETPET